MKPILYARLKLVVQGAVQGVGFRPFVYRLAAEQHLAGWVRNSPQGVFVEAEGARVELETFLRRLQTENPPHSSIQGIEFSWLDVVGYNGFQIRESETSGTKTALVLPDIATCPECLREIFDPGNRRYLYPFTNCTHCGPRFSIIESLPYDRANTSMKNFVMCPKCRKEYDDPSNRRFHAQPNACPDCGPRLELWKVTPGISFRREMLARGHAALAIAAEAIRSGQIVAVKGIGGFHLMADARSDEVITRLRIRKHREEKPFALLFPSLASAQNVCEISALEQRLLLSSEAPIVLLKRKLAISNPSLAIAGSVAPENPNLGVMLPSNPLHHILMGDLNFPIVATSGNLSDEPICIEEPEAFEGLRGIADLFLMHDRPIVRHMDDSIVRVVLGREMVLRRARGHAPLSVQIQNSKFRNQNVLAVGGHLKNSIALAVGPRVFISQHIGDLENEKANAAFRRVIADFKKLYDAQPEKIAADLHPDYLSTQFARAVAANPFGVQHHVAHVLSCMADNGINSPVLGVAWDGTGFGLDNTIWGGEFFLMDGPKVERVAHLRAFPLPGAGNAIREPGRAAAGLLYEMLGKTAFELTQLPPFQKLSPAELRALNIILQHHINSPLTSSVGRLFDAVASLIGLRQITRFEGQAAMELEFAIGQTNSRNAYSMAILQGQPAFQLDWQPMIEAVLFDIRQGVTSGEISIKFHNALVEGIVEIAKRIGEHRIVLSGGCFQNYYLLERAVIRLREENFQPFWHRSVPPNDGGIALGQIMAALGDITLADTITGPAAAYTKFARSDPPPK